MQQVKFGAWLTGQAHRDGPVGDLTADDGCGRCSNRPAEVPYWGVVEVVWDMHDHSASPVVLLDATGPVRAKTILGALQDLGDCLTPLSQPQPAADISLQMPLPETSWKTYPLIQRDRC